MLPSRSRADPHETKPYIVTRASVQDAPEHRPVSSGHTPDLWSVAPDGLRLAAQDEAPERLKRHGVRDALRFAVLLSFDGLAFLALRSAMRFLRGQGRLTVIGDQFFTSHLGGLQFAVALFVSLLIVGAYRRGGGWRSPWRWLNAVTLATALVLWQSLWTQDLLVVLVQFVATVVSVTLALAVLRGTLATIVGFMWQRAGAALTAVVVGDHISILQAAQSPVFTKTSGYRVSHELSTDKLEMDANAIGAELASVVLSAKVDAVFIAGQLNDRLFRQVIEVAHATGCELVTLSRSWHLAGVLPLPRVCCGVHLTSLTRPGLRAHQLAVKRLMDIVCSGLGLMFLSPLLALLAIAVKTTSKGPVFFKQERVGRGGAVFVILKFRTMRHGADDEKAGLTHLNHTGDSRLFKIPNDPRVTRVGAFLRRWSLDELPQVVNVFRGEMSLVGPRPFFPQDLDKYQEHHFLRLAARPGITGLWQVRGRSNISNFEEVVALDREYIDAWSSWLDFKILALTVPAVFRRRGAY